MPSSLVLVGHSVPRSRSLATTVAPTIAEFDGSVTRPVMPALISWDSSGTEHRLIPAQRSDRSFFIQTTFRELPLAEIIHQDVRTSIVTYLCPPWAVSDRVAF